MEKNDAAEIYRLPKDGLLLRWYDTELHRTTGIGYDESQGLLDDFARTFADWCGYHHLKQKICQDWGYCEKLKVYGRSLDLALALASFIAGILKLDEAGSLPAAVLIVREGLGVVCECGEPPKQ